MISNFHYILVIWAKIFINLHHACNLHLKFLYILAYVWNFSYFLITLYAWLNMIISFLVDAHYQRFYVYTFFYYQTYCVIPYLHFFKVFFSLLIKFFLAFQIWRIALFHIFINSFQSFLILLHTLLQIFFILFLLFKYLRISNLFACFISSTHLFLNIYNKWIMIPITL